MYLDEIKRGLRAEIKKRQNEQYFTFQTNIRQMCVDVLAKLEEQESEIAELQEQVHDYAQGLYVMQARAEKETRHQKYKRCLAMATACHEQVKHYKVEYDADEGFGDNWLKWIHWAKKWKTRWLKLAYKFKEGV